MFKKYFLKIAINIIKKKANDPRFQLEIVRAVNRKVDIPNLTEEQEKELFKAILKALIAYISR